MGRRLSSDELSEKGLLSIWGVVSWNSVISESRLADLPRSVWFARVWLSSSSSVSDARLPLRACECSLPSSDESVELAVRGRPAEVRRSGVLTRVRSVSVVELELFGGVVSELFFLVIWRALTGPS